MFIVKEIEHEELSHGICMDTQEMFLKMPRIVLFL